MTLIICIGILVIYAWAQYDVSKWNPKNIQKIQDRLEQEYIGTFEFIEIQKDAETGVNQYFYRYSEIPELSATGSIYWYSMPWFPLLPYRYISIHFSETLLKSIIQTTCQGEVNITGMELNESVDKIYKLIIGIDEQMKSYIKGSFYTDNIYLEVIDGNTHHEVEFHSFNKNVIWDQLMEIRTK